VLGWVALVLIKPMKFYAWKRPEPKSAWEPDLSVSLETFPSFLSVGLVYFLFDFWLFLSQYHQLYFTKRLFTCTF
jgi:hypothetical protein